MTDESRTGTSETAAPPVTRRSFLFTLGIALNIVAATLFAVPIIGFVLSPVRRMAFQAWIALGPLTAFPENQTRLATYTNPFVKPWDGQTANLPCWVRR